MRNYSLSARKLRVLSAMRGLQVYEIGYYQVGKVSMFERIYGAMKSEDVTLLKSLHESFIKKFVLRNS